MKKNVTWVEFLFVLSQCCHIKLTHVGHFSSPLFISETECLKGGSASAKKEMSEAYCGMSVVLSKSLFPGIGDLMDRNIMFINRI
jgi:hypothetical protein